MLLHFSGSGSSAHADVFDGAAKSRHLVSFKMGQRNQNIGVHDGSPDESGFAVHSARHRHLHIIRSSQPVRNDDLTSRRCRVEAVQIGTVQML